MINNLKKKWLFLLVFVLTVCVIFSMSMLISKDNTQAETISGFEVSEGVTVEFNDNGDKLLKFKTEVGEDWLTENSSSAYTFGTIIYPTDNGNVDDSKTPFENKESLDGVNIITKSSQAVTEGFTYNASVLFDKETIYSWILSQKPELEGDEDGLESALSKVYGNLYAKNFTAVSYAVTDSGIIYSSGVSNSVTAVEELEYSTEGVLYEVVDNSYAQVSGYTGTATEVVIASQYQGYPTIIGNYAFYNCSSLTSIEIPDSVTSIGSHAFYGCSSLTSVTIGNGVTSIGDYAFYGCYKLTRVTIGNSVTSIGDCAFYDCYKLTSIEIPDSITSIGEDAFYNCSSLDYNIIHGEYYLGNNKNPCLVLIKATDITSHIIYDNTKIIYSQAFSGCSSLASVTIGNSVTNIGEYAFYGCNKLTKVNYTGTIDSWASIEFDENPIRYAKSLYINNELQTDIAINAEKIYSSAFTHCDSLTSVTIGNSVTSIGEDAFSVCSSLASVMIGNSVTNIGEYAFNGCSSLTSVTIGNSVTSIGFRAFTDCDSLTSVTIGNSVTSIGEEAFSDCSSLTSIEIPNSVTSIGEEAFSVCSLLTSIEIPDSVTSIGAYAFYGCDSLTSVTIGKNVTSIGDGAFKECRKLTEIYFNATACADLSLDNGVFYGGGNKVKGITVNIGANVTKIPANLFYAWSGNTSYSPKIISVVFADNSVCESIGDGAFVVYNGTTITIPNSVTAIGSRAFQSCGKLMSITIPENVTSIGAYAFLNCRSLESITISKNVTSIGDYAFSGCTGITEINYNATACVNGDSVFYHAGQDGEGITVNIGANVTKIPRFSCDMDLPKIISVVFADNSVCESIGGDAFSYCKSLTSIEIPNSVTSIGSRAFYGCDSLTSIEIPNSVTNICDYVFYGCDSLMSIEIPNSVTSIGEEAFYGCDSLTSIEIPNSVMSIGVGAFYDCSSLTSIEIPDSVTSIGSSAFYRCDSLTSVTIGKNLTSIGAYAFKECRKLTEINFNATACGDLSLYNCVFYNAGQDGEGITVNIGANVTKIPANLFYAWHVNTSYSPKIICVVFADNSVCESIGTSAFFDCSSLMTIEIPNSVTSIGGEAFYGCTKLTKINYNATACADLSLDNCVFYNAGQDGEGVTVNIGANVTKIPAYLFYPDSNTSCLPKIISVVFAKNSVCESIGTCAFRKCTSLTSVMMPNSVTSIGTSAFYGCTSLSSIEIPNSVTSIGTSAFNDCTSLSSIEIPNSVTSIGVGAFSGCSSLIKVNYTGTIDEWASIVFGDYTANPIYYAKKLYINDVNVLVGKITINGSKIGSYAFSRCTSLTNVMIGENVTSIGSRAFDNCTSLTSITIGENVTSIGGDAFRSCSSLTSIEIPNSVTSIGNSAFDYCMSLTSITIGENVTSIYPFNNLSSLTSIKVAEGNAKYKSIDGNLYSKDGKTLIRYAMGKTAMSFTVPNSVTNIGDYAFYNCSKLIRVTIPNSVTSIGSQAFSGCSSLMTINIPNSVTSIGNWAFDYCESLTSVTIGNGVTSIGTRVFSDCNLLTSISFNGSMAKWNAISKNGAWAYGSAVTYVQCSNGQVAI